MVPSVTAAAQAAVATPGGGHLRNPTERRSGLVTKAPLSGGRHGHGAPAAAKVSKALAVSQVPSVTAPAQAAVAAPV